MVKRRAYRKRSSIRRKKQSKTLLKSRPFKIAVKKVIHRMSENKTWTFSSTPLSGVPLTAAITGSTSLTSINPWTYELLPQLSQGTGNSNRIGNRVRMVKNNIRGFINLKPYNATTNTYQAPVMVKLWVFSPKSFSNFTGDMGWQNWTQFFRINNADTGFTGALLDLAYHVNTELYTLHTTRTYQLNNNGSGAAVYQSPSGKFIQPFNINLIRYAKDLKYDDNSSQRCTNKNLIICATTCYGDGTVNGYLVPNDQAEIHFIHECEFEDL